MQHSETVVGAAVCVDTQKGGPLGQTAQGMDYKSRGQRLSQRKGTGTGQLRLSDDVQNRPHNLGKEPRSKR